MVGNIAQRLEHAHVLRFDTRCIGQLSLKSGQYLNLDPLILYSNEGVEEKTGADGDRVTVQTGIHDVFLYNGRNGNHYTYLACNKGGELTTRDAQAREYLERGFGEIKALFGVGSGAES